MPIDASELIRTHREWESTQGERAPDGLASEARELLGLAALREEIPVERARTFAMTALSRSDVGRWALAVLRGEPHASRARIELALAVLQHLSDSDARAQGRYPVAPKPRRS